MHIYAYMLVERIRNITVFLDSLRLFDTFLSLNLAPRYHSELVDLAQKEDD